MVENTDLYQPVQNKIMATCRVSHSGGGPTPILQVFLKNSPPEPMLSPWGTPPLKNEAHHLKNTPPPPPQLKHETPFHEMIPRKSTIDNNLKSS